MKDKVKDIRLTKTALTKDMRLIITLMSVRRKTSLMYKFTKWWRDCSELYISS